LTEPKAKLLQSVGDAISGGSDAADRVRLALGRRTEAVRGRLADRFVRTRHRHGAVTPEGDDRPHGADDPSS
jgi:hypothetical protein